MDRTAITLLIALTVGFAGTLASAQDTSEINRIIRGLAPIAGQTIAGDPNPPIDPAPELGVQPVPRTGLVEVVLPNRVILVDTSYAMDFEVYFPFDSAELTPLAQQELAALGGALASVDLRPYHYLIAGHTDGIGNPSYNLELSQRRAAAVRKFLIEAFPIIPDRLVSVGFGQERLKQPDQPRAAINRRVEVLLVASE